MSDVDDAGDSGADGDGAAGESDAVESGASDSDADGSTASAAGSADATAAAPDEERPDPADVVDDLDQPVLLFDGVCNLCNGFVRFVVERDDEGVFLFAPLQGPVGQELLERHGLATEDFDTMVLVEPDGSYATKSEAALQTARRLDAPWSLSSPLLHLPRVVRDGVYELVAANRYRLFGKREDACELPEPELRERFAERSLE